MHLQTLTCVIAVLFSAALAQPTKTQPGPHIYQGSPVYVADAEKYKYMGVLLDNTDSVICGAFVASPAWFITAAHCVSGLAPSSLKVQTGKDARATSIISQIIIHPNYNATAGLGNDIALVKFSPDLVFSEKLGTIGRASESAAVGTKGRVTGYGALMPDQRPGVYLYYKDVTVADKKGCPGLVEGQICVTPDVLCLGDAGSPLVANDNLIGIGISDATCGTTGSDVYTDVAYYKDWIDQYAGSASSIFLSPLALLSTIIAILKIRC